MKTLLMTMACLGLASTALAQNKEAKGVHTAEVRGCYVIEVRQMFFNADLHLSIPGNGTFSFLANTKRQGPMSEPCTGTVVNSGFTASAQVSCERMLAVSRTKDGKPYDWEKTFKLDLDLSKAKRDANGIRKVKVTNTQGSNGAETTMTVDLKAEPCN